MKLFFDTETTGLPLFREAPADSRQPHIVQLGAILCDEQRRVVGELNLIVKPDGWTIPDEAAKVHGITTERALRYGVPLRRVMGLFVALADLAEELVAHSYSFDDLMVRSALARLECQEALENQERRKWFCTMRAATPVLKLPGRYGDFKWPSLQEAYTHFMGKPFDGAHDAMADVRACSAVYYALPQNQVAKPAVVPAQ